MKERSYKNFINTNKLTPLPERVYKSSLQRYVFIKWKFLILGILFCIGGLLMFLGLIH